MWLKNMRNIEIESQHLSNFKPESQAGFSVHENDICINNVFGINKDGTLPARFLSGFLSTFSLARTIQEISDNTVNPHIRIFRPVNISRYINGISEEDAKRQIRQGDQLLQILASQHFAEIDFSIEDDIPITETALEILSQVAILINLHCDEETIRKVKESGRLRGGEQGEQKALTYVAHHPFGWSDLHHSSIFRDAPPQNVINTLPPSERKYTEVRQRLKQVIEADSGLLVPTSTRHELVINMCGTPHYIFLEDGQGNKQEPSFDEILSVTCTEVINDMLEQFKREGNPFLKENLRRAVKDLEKVFLVFAKGNPDAIREETVQSLIGKGMEL